MRRWLAFVAMGVLLSCQDQPLTGPAAPRPTASILDARHSGGNAHFFFLPPLVPDPSGTGTFDATLSPMVRICMWTGAACGALVAEFTMTTGPGSETVRLDAAGGQYTVNWHTDQFALDPARTYRIAVLVAGTELGHADVDVVSTGRELRNVQTGEYVGLVNGRTLPIKFRIERGAVSVVGAAGGTVTAANGAVSISIPAGALDANVGITVAPVSDPVSDARAVAGTGFEFGPDGLQFGTPAQLRIAYDPERLLAGVRESSLRVFKVYPYGIVEVPGSVVDTAANVVSAPISSFSTYIVGQGGSVSFSTFLTEGAIALWGSGPSDVYALGTDALTLRHFDGASWSVVNTGSSRELVALSGAGPSAVFAAGFGIVVRYDGVQWQPILDGIRETGSNGRVLLADMDGDGRADLVQLGAAGNYGVDVLFGTGAGQFGPVIHYAGPDRTELELGDLNGDGRTDVVVGGGWSTSQTIGVHLNTGGGALAAAVTYVVPWPFRASCRLADVNGDARPDCVVAAVGGSQVGVLLNDGTGSFGSFIASPAGGLVFGLDVGDLDEDGHADVLVALGWDDRLTVLRGNGTGAFGSPVTIAEPGTPSSVRLGDADRDGHLDVAVGHLGDPRITVRLGTGTAAFGSSVAVPMGPSSGNPVWADLDSDGIPDLLTEPGAVAFGDGSGAFGPPRAVIAPTQGGFGVGDVNSDGLPDLVTSANGIGVAVLINTDGGGFTPVPDIRAIWAASPTDVYAVAENAVLRYDGTSWQVIRSSLGSERYASVWGLSPSNVYVVGSGLVLRYNGSVWQSMGAAAGPFTAIWGSSPSDLFVGAYYGNGVEHFDGSTWTTLPLPSEPYPRDYVAAHGLWGTSGADVYLIGEDLKNSAAVLYYNGVAWVWLTPRETTFSVPLAVWGSSANDVWISTNGEILRGTR